MKKTIFTCLFGDYDNLLQAPNFKGWDAVLFTDQELTDNKGWQVRKVKSENSRISSRHYKWLSHVHLSEYNLVCYLDANMRLMHEPPNSPMFFIHPTTRKLYDEFEKVRRASKADIGQLDRQINFYRSERFRDIQPIYANGFFIRDHSEQINIICQETYNLTAEFTHRDQLALPFILFKTGLKLPSQRYSFARRFIQLLPHKPVKVSNEKVYVHHITPARADKNFGKAINQLIEHLPDNDWICLRDIDTVPVNHVEFIKQCEEIANRGDFDLVSCMTNRLGLGYQLVGGKINESMNFLDHMEIGKKLASEFGSQVVKCPASVGGIMMMFSKKTWLRIGKVPEGGICLDGKYIDYHISEKVSKLRMKTGIAKGIYLWHTYRIGLEGKKHLL